jgi:hypothetical protein
MPLLRGRMIVIEFFERGMQPRSRAPATSKWGVTDMNDYRMICFFYLGLFQP